MEILQIPLAWNGSNDDTVIVETRSEAFSSTLERDRKVCMSLCLTAPSTPDGHARLIIANFNLRQIHPLKNLKLDSVDNSSVLLLISHSSFLTSFLKQQ